MGNQPECPHTAGLWPGRLNQRFCNTIESRAALIQPCFFVTKVHMTRFALLSTALAGLMLSEAAFAQTAPIRIGPNRTLLPAEITTETQLARQSARITELESQIAQLTGRVETLEFRLTQSEKGLEAAQQDKADLLQRMGRLETRLDDLSRRTTQQTLTSRTTPQPDNSRIVSTFPGPTTTTRSTISQGTTTNRVVTTTRTAPTQQTVRSETGRLPEGSLGTISASQLPGEAGPLFAMGKSRLLAFDYDGAEEAFRKFLDEFGDDDQAGEAHYWLGEVLYQQGDFAGSARFLTTMLQSYQDDPRRGDGVVKLARSLREIGETERACLFLSRLDQVDPNASAVTRNLAAVEKQRSGCD